MTTSKFFKPVTRLILFSGLVSVLAACNASTGNKTQDALDLSGSASQGEQEDQALDLRAFCPKTVLRGGTETLRLYADGVKKEDPGSLNSLRFQSTITEVVRECNYRTDMLNMRVGIAGRAINGPTGETGNFQTPVRIAVTRGDEVLYSQLHQIPVTIAEGRTNGSFRFVDSNVNVPIPDKPNLVVYVGYDEGPYETPKKKKLEPVN